MRIACIGSRIINSDQEKLFFKVGAWIVQQGFYISSGNADGSDFAFQNGGNSIDPKKVILYLAWPTYNQKYLVNGNTVFTASKPEWTEIAAKHHDKWDNLKQGAKKLFCRNVGIVARADKVIALPDHSKPGRGGTGHSMRVAEGLKIPVLDLNGKTFEKIVEWIK